MSTDNQRIRIQTWARNYKGPKHDDFLFDDQAFETVIGIGGLIHELLIYSNEGRDPLTLADLARAMIWALVGHGVTANEIHHITEEVPVHGPNLLCSKLVMSEVCPLGLPSLNHSGTPSHRKPRLPSWPSWTPSTDESLSWSDVSAISRPG